MKLANGKFYRNGHGDVHGPVEERAPNVWLDENGILYHPDGRQWDHTAKSAGNLIAEDQPPARIHRSWAGHAKSGACTVSSTGAKSMSGPFCNTCMHFRRMPLSEGAGECGDPTKAIITRGGNRVGEAPSVEPDYTCSNHAPIPQAIPEERKS